MTAPWRAILRLVIAVAAAVVAAAAVAADQPLPILRIETTRHNSQLNAMAIDAQAHLLVTVGNDDTARIWSLPDLRALGVLRPPIGPKSDGALYAVAVSPDGSLAAVGGYDPEIRLFDLQGHEVVRRWTNLPDSVLSLAISVDGSRLAVGLGSQGLRILSVSDGRVLAEDKDYGGGVYGLDFAGDGRLAAASLDGGLRLYDASGAKHARVATAAGHRPTHVRFSPDGTLLAIGFNDAAAVELRSGSTLELRGRPSVNGLSGRSLEAVAWSPDGRTLFAGGATTVRGMAPVFAWAQSGSGARRVAERGFASLVAAIVALPGGRLVLGSIDSDLAVAYGDGQREAELTPLRADFVVGSAPTHPSRQFRLSPDGARVEWVPLAPQVNYAAFDATQLLVTNGTQPGALLTDWSDQAGGLQVSGWDGGWEPKLNGKPLPLEANERAEAVAVRDGKVLLGTEWMLRLFDGSGRQVWGTRLPASAWRVNQSPDGRLAVAALGDGTLRWYRMSDGHELLATFLTRSDDRWIAFTPSGYYAAAPGAEDLIGWHLNRGAGEAADFFPASRFRDRFYRPDIVRLVLAKLDEAEAVRVANLARGIGEAKAAPLTEDLPPVLTILSPPDRSQVAGSHAEVEFSVRSPSGRDLRDFRVLVNGVPVSSGITWDPPEVPRLASPDSEARQKVDVPITGADTVTLAILADTDSRTSAPAKVSLRGPAPAPVAKPRNPLGPRMNAVLIGVSAYGQDTLRRGVEYAADDATSLRDLLEKQRGRGLYREVNTRLVVDGDATRDGVVDALDWLRRTTTSNDISIVFMAGHGVNDDGRVFFLPVNGDVDRLTATGLSQADLLLLLGRVVGRKVAFLDFCHAGGAVLVQKTRGLDDVDIVGLLNQLREPGSGLIVFAAATAREPAVQLDDRHHGAFTVALLEALQGSADLLQRGAIGTGELNVFLADRVRTLTDGRQHPIMERADDLPDFPLVVTR
jgi:Caspase domain/WD domain, G-beta repeat